MPDQIPCVQLAFASQLTDLVIIDSSVNWLCPYCVYAIWMVICMHNAHNCISCDNAEATKNVDLYTRCINVIKWRKKAADEEMHDYNKIPFILHPDAMQCNAPNANHECQSPIWLTHAHAHAIISISIAKWRSTMCANLYDFLVAASTSYLILHNKRHHTRPDLARNKLGPYSCGKKPIAFHICVFCCNLSFVFTLCDFYRRVLNEKCLQKNVCVRVCGNKCEIQLDTINWLEWAMTMSFFAL